MNALNTLTGRLIASLLAVLVLSQVLSVFLFATQQEANEQNNRERQFFRLAESAAEVIDRMQPFEQREALRSFSRRDTRFSLDATPLAAEGDERDMVGVPPNMRVQHFDDPRTLWTRYVEMTSDPPQPPQRRPPPRRPDRQGPDGQGPNRLGPGRAGPDGQRPPPPGFEGGPEDNIPQVISTQVSLPLSNGQWLNGRLNWPDRAPPWVKPLLGQALLTAIGFMFVVVVLVRRNTRNLKKLAIAAERVGRGEEVEPLEESGPVEIKRTAQAFNAMTAQIKRMIYGRTRMLAAISHDLRTPITALRIRAELVEEDENRERMLATLAEMQSLAEATLTLARQDAVVEETQTVDLAALVESICDDLADIGQAVAFAPAARTPYPCRAGIMKRAVRNLVENAVKYGTRADVSLEQTAKNILIHVDDAGPGVLPEQMKKLFQPFVRLEESRSKDTGGFGLGLSIARSIVDGHGGEITLSNRSTGGLRATISLPKVRVEG